MLEKYYEMFLNGLIFISRIVSNRFYLLQINNDGKLRYDVMYGSKQTFKRRRIYSCDAIAMYCINKDTGPSTLRWLFGTLQGH